MLRDAFGISVGYRLRIVKFKQHFNHDLGNININHTENLCLKHHRGYQHHVDGHRVSDGCHRYGNLLQRKHVAWHGHAVLWGCDAEHLFQHRW